MSTKTDPAKLERACRDAMRSLLTAGLDVSSFLFIASDAIEDCALEGCTLHQKNSIREVVRGAARFASVLEDLKSK